MLQNMSDFVKDNSRLDLKDDYVFKKIFSKPENSSERGLTVFCSFVKIRVFVGISIFTRVFVYRTFVHF